MSRQRIIGISDIQPPRPSARQLQLRLTADWIRGARITGDLSVPGSNFGMSFTTVVGDFELVGSGSTLLNNGFCGTVTISGSGRNLLGNAGMAPIPAPASC